MLHSPAPALTSICILDDHVITKKQTKKKKWALPFYLPKLSRKDCSSVFAFCIFRNFLGNRAGIFGYAGTVKANRILLDWQQVSSGTGPETASATSISHCWKQTELSRNSPLWTFLVSIPVRINLSQWAGSRNLAGMISSLVCGWGQALSSKGTVAACL